MKRLNKKLSGVFRKKIDQVEKSSIYYLIAITFVLISLKLFLGLDPYSSTLLYFTVFWILVSFESRAKYVTYVSALILSFTTLTTLALLVSGLTVITLIGLRKLMQLFDENLFLVFTGFILHVGDILTTLNGINAGLKEQNPFINYIIPFLGDKLGLGLSKIVLFGMILFVYKRDIEDLNFILKIFFLTGLYLALSNFALILGNG